jgi:diadenosine tetraphosphate (Ap4A) HIT family hydrolase
MKTIKEELIDFKRLQFYESDFWIWQIHENQSYLGRIILMLKRDLDLSCAFCTDQEWLSLKSNFALYEEFLNSVFRPDRYNYGQLGNIFPQLHFHIVPRYKSNRSWNSIEFQDLKWGRNWSPSPKSPITVEDTYNFSSWLKEKFKHYLVKQK